MRVTRRQLLYTAGVGLSVSSSLSSSASTRAPVSSVSAAATQTLEPLGSVSVDGAADAVAADGTAYVATLTGFATVDVSDRTEPTVLADYQGVAADHPDGPLEQIQDVAVAGDTLAVAGPANRVDGDQLHALVFFDVSDPTTPEQLGDPYETDVHIHNCTFSDGLCYYVANDGETNALVIVDPEDRVEVGRWSVLEVEPRWADVHWQLWYLHDVSVHDGIAYLPYWNAGTYLVDVSDPTEPTYRSHVAGLDVDSQLEVAGSEIEAAQRGPPGNDHTAVVDETGELLAIGRETWALEAGDPEGASGIELVDVTDSTAPESLATISPPSTSDASYHGGEWTTAHNFELRNGHLYASWYQGGVTVHDVRDPAEPTPVAAWRDTEETAFWTAQLTGETVVASSTPMIPNTDIEGALYTFQAVEAGDEGVEDRGDDSVPGFGLVAALAGVGGLTAYAAHRLRNTDSRS